MAALRSHIALLLLLCLTRTLVPEAWLLALHGHSHTTHEPVHPATSRHKGKVLVSPGHQHCEVEQFYSAAYQAAIPVALPRPRTAPRYAAVAAALAVRAMAGRVIRPSALRGPPCSA